MPDDSTEQQHESEPLGPTAPPADKPFNKILRLQIAQASRDDLVAWLSAARVGGSGESLTVEWRNGGRRNLRSQTETLAPRIAEIQQVEEVESIFDMIAYPDDSQLVFRLRRGFASVAYSSKIDNSIAQHRAYGLRNSQRMSPGSQKRFSRSSNIRLTGEAALSVFPAFVLTFVTIYIVGGGSSGTPALYTGLLIVSAFTSIFFVTAGMIYQYRIRSLTRFDPDPLVLAYSRRRSLTAGAAFGLLVGLATIAAAVFGLIAILPR